QEPPFFIGLKPEPAALQPIKGARVLAVLGDSVTTDHISPARDIAKGSPAAKYLEAESVSREEFNSYGSRRGNDRVMVRGTFANIRIRNFLAPGTEGGVTKYLGPSPKGAASASPPSAAARSASGNAAPNVGPESMKMTSEGGGSPAPAVGTAG